MAEYTDILMKHVYIFIKQNFYRFDKELNAFCKDNEWEKLKLVHLSTTNVHITLALIFSYFDLYVIKDNFYYEYLNELDKNTLLFAFLLHDISKHIKLNHDLKEEFGPERQPADVIHPFKSAATALIILYNNNYLFDDNQDNKTNTNNDTTYIKSLIDEIYDFLIKSVKIEFVKKKDKECYIMDNTNVLTLLENFNKLRKLSDKNNWIVDIVLLIAFHQSLPNNKFNMSVCILDDEKIQKIFNLRLMLLMKIFMLNDSGVHSLYKLHHEFHEQIIENMDETINRLFLKMKDD